MTASISAKSILAQMPHHNLTRISGQPTHADLKILKKELAANLMAIPCPWGHNKGYLGLIQDPAICLQQNRGAYNTPANQLQDSVEQHRQKILGSAVHGRHTSSCELHACHDS